MARPRKGNELGASEGVALRITPELRAELDRLAAEHGRTITQELRIALEDHVIRNKTVCEKSESVRRFALSVAAE